jgi:hypothetical protein
VKEINIHWEVEDGYVGKNRPQHLRLTTDDFEDFGDATLEEIKEEIEKYVQDDFEEKISFYVGSLDHLAEQILEELRKEEQ